MNHDVLYENLSYDWSEDSSRIFHTAAPQIKNSFLYIQEAGYFKTFPTYYAERANLNSFLVLLTLSGEGMLDYQEHLFSLTPGKLFWIDCTVHHRYSNTGSEWEFLWLHFYGMQAKEFHTLYMEQNSSPVINLVGQMSDIENILQKIVNITSQMNLETDIEASALIQLLLSKIVLACMQNVKAEIPEYLSPILQYLDQSYAQSISLDDLSIRFGISKYHLSREFKRVMGCTLWDYLLQKRISYSKELLRDTNKPVYEIASLCGFNQSPYFIKTFRKYEGISPLVYRKLWKS